MTFADLKFETRGAVARIAIDRPHRLNALRMGVSDKALIAAFDRVAGDEAIRVAILTGSGGKAFCSGWDLEAIDEIPLAELESLIRGNLELFFKVWHLSKPVIAAINGYALGTGSALALACDLAFAADNARLGEPEIRHGALSPFPILPFLTHSKAAHELYYSGDLLGAEDLLRLGLVNRVVAADGLEEAAWACAERLARVPPLSLQLTKRSLRASYDIMGLTAAMRQHALADTIAIGSDSPRAEGAVRHPGEAGHEGVYRGARRAVRGVAEPRTRDRRTHLAPRPPGRPAGGLPVRRAVRGFRRAGSADGPRRRRPRRARDRQGRPGCGADAQRHRAGVAVLRGGQDRRRPVPAQLAARAARDRPHPGSRPARAAAARPGVRGLGAPRPAPPPAPRSSRSRISPAARPAGAAPAACAAPDDPLLLVYTSGTTGRSKGAVLSHRQMLWTALTMAATLDYGRGDVDLIAAPLFHVGGLSFATLSVYLGACSAILPAWDAAAALRLIAAARVNHFFAVAAMAGALASHADFAAADLSSLRWVMAGGGPVPAALIEAFAGRDIPLLQTYGTTETGGPATVVDIDHAAAKAGSAGLPFFHTDVRIAGDASETLGTGEVGEIQVRGPHVAAYWRDPAATAAARDGDWFRSGDLGYRDADGYLYVLGRGGELIVSGGENVHPAEVEAVLADLPGIDEAAVIGVPDPRWGETVCAVVIPAAGRTISLAAVRAHCAGRIAAYKTPRRLVVATEPLPRGATGKIRRGELRERLGAAGGKSVQHQ